MKKIICLMMFFWGFQKGQSQILMSLIFGDKLNSPNIEFGLEGGANFSTISNQENANFRTNFNLGFYFDFNLKNPSWVFNTGVMVKSSMGAKSLPVYGLNDENLDKVFSEGTVNRKINYFNIPLMLKYKFENNFYVKGGGQLGMLSKARDIFQEEYNGSDVEYKNKIRDQIHVIDAGLAFGLGYRLKVGYGCNLGIQYYHGLVPIFKGDSNPTQYNRSIYVTAGLPIGKAKAEKRRAAQKLEENESAP